MTDGCGTSIASGSIVTEMAKEKSISEAGKITRRDVLDALGRLPEESEHCALLAANMLTSIWRCSTTNIGELLDKLEKAPERRQAVGLASACHLFC